MLVLCEFSQACLLASVLPPLAQPLAFSPVFRKRGICSACCDGKRSDASGEWAGLETWSLLDCFGIPRATHPGELRIGLCAFSSLLTQYRDNPVTPKLQRASDRKVRRAAADGIQHARRGRRGGNEGRRRGCEARAIRREVRRRRELPDDGVARALRSRRPALGGREKNSTRQLSRLCSFLSVC